MKIGVTRVRNESEIILDTLNHVSKYMDGIIVYDDASTDNTVQIVESHPKVLKIIKNLNWVFDPHKRQVLEGTHRQEIYSEALKFDPEWIYVFDSDEFATFEGVEWNNPNVGGYKLRLFDFYITEEDSHLNYTHRKFMGPEYRDILMLFKPNNHIKFTGREPGGVMSLSPKIGGYVKHYGKSMSIKQWEETCDYYINFLYEPQLAGGTISEKWKKRKGKAIHTHSDFGKNLITWEERYDSNKILDNSLGQQEKIYTQSKKQ